MNGIAGSNWFAGEWGVVLGASLVAALTDLKTGLSGGAGARAASLLPAAP